jgi:5-methylcytosine-specific restriction endonuclease McrA
MEIKNLEIKIIEFQNRESDFQKKYSNIISEAVKYWPSYPPKYFWNELRLESISRAKGRCSECKSKNFRNGHVHHRYPLAKGGLNEINNLIYLCYSCHQRRHVHSIGGNGSGTKAGIKKKYSNLTIKEKLELALSMNQKNGIKYIDNKHNLTERWIKIDKIYSEKNEYKKIWIEAYCFLRDDTRSFRLDGVIEASVKNKLTHNEIEFDI